jgi:DNA polymerase I-like protein with 3'-5' exonuclease and polymerase domains|tara:strand:+ start:40943 stop:41818 length:876 start_codon:yes stop_codon:yes gene_type:complete
MTRYILADVEANGLDPDKIHCISAKEYPNGKVIRWTRDELEYFIAWVEAKPVTKWFFHNGLNYDVDVINKLVKPDLIKHEDVVDTQVVSRLVDYKRYNTHSLKEIGISLGVHKGDYTGGWEEYTEEMGDYCDQDVEVLHAIVDDQWKYITDPQWSESMRLEHEMAVICKEMQTNGFLFNKPEAELMLSEVKEEMEKLEESFRTAFGTKRVELKRCKYRLTKDGSLYGNVRKDFEEYDDIEIDGEEYVVYEQKEFNPGSPKERIDALWDAGWKPTDKTKGHINKLKERKRNG